MSFVSTTSSIAGASDTDIGSSAGHILGSDGSDSFDNVAVSGDVTLASSGAMTIGSGVVETGPMIADSNVTIGKIDFLVDEDNMDRLIQQLRKVPSQQSVKAYVDSQLTAQDLDKVTQVVHYQSI